MITAKVTCLSLHLLYMAPSRDWNGLQSPTGNSSIRDQIGVNFIPARSLTGQKAARSGESGGRSVLHLPVPDIHQGPDIRCLRLLYRPHGLNIPSSVAFSWTRRRGVIVRRLSRPCDARLNTTALFVGPPEAKPCYFVSSCFFPMPMWFFPMPDASLLMMLSILIQSPCSHVCSTHWGPWPQLGQGQGRENPRDGERGWVAGKS
jgi:hypothetical protein